MNVLDHSELGYLRDQLDNLYKSDNDGCSCGQCPEPNLEVTYEDYNALLTVVSKLTLITRNLMETVEKQRTDL